MSSELRKPKGVFGAKGTSLTALLHIRALPNFAQKLCSDFNVRLSVKL
jgi:hypothetical protein